MPKSPRSPASSSQNLTQSQKQQLIAYHEEQRLSNPSYLQKDLPAWAKSTFQLSYTPSRVTIYRILKQATQPDRSPSPSSSKKKLPSKLEDLENLLADWIHQQESRHVMLNHHLIKQQGHIFQNRLNSTLPPDQQLALKFSNGWLEKFNKRHSFSQHLAHGEAGSVDQQALQQELPAIKHLIQQFSPEDVFNADETALFYCNPPVKTIASRSVSGIKRNKTRFTILLACNSTGSEKLEPFFIGKAKQPRPFKKSSAAQLGIHYTSNTKAWMTSDLFTSWLQHVDAQIGLTSGRHILLLLDNCSAHGSLQKPLTALQNITIHFLPPNTTSRIQPLDAGIIAAFKKHYRAKQYSLALLESEMGGTDIYKVDILTAMRYCQQIWKDLSETTIRNCWRHTGLVDWEEAAQEETAVDQELEGALRRLAEVTVEDVVHMEDEEQVAGEEEAEDEDEEDEEELDDIQTPPGSPKRLAETGETLQMTSQEQIEILRSAKAILEKQGLLDSHVLGVLDHCSLQLGNE